MSALLSLFGSLKNKLIAALLAMLAALWIALQVMARSNRKAADKVDELSDKVREHEVKEEADAHRRKPVGRDKSAILDRM